MEEGEKTPEETAKMFSAITKALVKDNPKPKTKGSKKDLKKKS